MLGTVGASRARALQGSLISDVKTASEEYGVPAELLLAMGYVNTLWEMPSQRLGDYDPGNIHGMGGYGIMRLREDPETDTLAKAAGLTGISREDLESDRAANIKGGAAVLAKIQGGNPSSINGWYDAVAEYSDGPLYANQVYMTLQDGASKAISSGEEVTLAHQPRAEPREMFQTFSSADYDRATFYGAYSGNYYNASRGATQINRIVIHVVQGSWAGAINWFNDPRAGVSAHYVVRRSDGKIGQCVRDQDIAYHAGNLEWNKTAIGIEHEGYADNQGNWTDSMLRSSARLSANLCKKWSIPIDRDHIVGHVEVPGSTHYCPGRYFPYSRYMDLVRRYARGSGDSYVQVVDNSGRRFSASSNWSRSEYSSQRYGEDYRFVKPKNVDDGVSYRFDTPARGRYAVYAWWPANSGYNSRTRFWILTSDGWKREVRTQRKNGGRWVELGRYTMDAGDKVRVKISRRSSANGYIVADAVKIRKL